MVTGEMTREFTCQGCGHSISENEAEDLVDAAQEHAEEAHDKEVPADTVRDEMIEEA